MKFLASGQESAFDLLPAGAKARGLARAMAVGAGLGASVPEFFVLLPAAFDLSLNPWQAQAARAARTGGQRRELVARMTLAPGVAREVARVARLLAGDSPLGAVALRLSPEDASRHGRPGFFPNVRPDEVAARVLDAWAAHYAADPAAPAGPPPALILQAMISPQASGEAFAADPITGRRRVARVRSNGTDWEVGPDEAGGSDPTASAAAGLARELSRRLGMPQRIEWALSGGNLHLLAAEPMATLAGLADPEGAAVEWDFGAPAEWLPGPVTALGFSLARRWFAAAVRAVALGLPGAEGLVPARAERLLGRIGGRLALNRTEWQAFRDGLAPAERAAWLPVEWLLGVASPVPGSEPPDAADDGSKAAEAARAARQAWFDALPSGTSLAALAALRADELMGRLRALEREFSAHLGRIAADALAATALEARVRHFCAKHLGDVRLAHALLGALPKNPASEFARRFRALAESVQADEAVVKALAEGSPAAVAAELERKGDFGAALRELGRDFASWAPGTPTPSAAPLDEDPRPLHHALGRYAAGFWRAPYHPPSAGAEEPRRTAEARAAAALAGASNLPRRWQWERLLAAARAALRRQADDALGLARAAAAARRILLELGARLVSLGRLDAATDILHLTFDEAAGFIEGAAESLDLRAMAGVRRGEWEAHGTVPEPPTRIQTRGAVHAGNDDLRPAPGCEPPDWTRPEPARGVPCSGGNARGPARVVRDGRAEFLRQGEILVVRGVPAGWMLHLPAASGIVAEHGSAAGFGALAARELGIPMVAGLPRLLESVRDGDWLEVDGGTGEVRRIPEPAVAAEGEELAPLPTFRFPRR